MNENKLQVAWDQIEKLRREDRRDTPEYLQVKNSLIEHYYPIVGKVARRMHKKLKEVQEDDLVSWGTDGLFDAVERFERERGFKFETYAMHRVRGAILDNIRKIDWIPRLVRQRATKLDRIRQQYEAKEGRTLTDGEVAEKLGIPIEEFEERVRRSTPIACVSMYSKADENEGEVIEFQDLSAEEKTPLDGLLRAEMFQKLFGTHFTKLEKKIIHLHYREGYTMKEIATMTNFSESRISQMHAEILARLHKKIERNPQYASDLICMFDS